MMSLSTVPHPVFPTAFRDIGLGLYHLFKRDATEEHCERLVSATLRVTAAAAVALSRLACVWYIDSMILSIVSGIALNMTVYALDPETAYLAEAATMTITGVFLLAIGVQLAVHSLYGAGAFFGLLGVGCIGFAHSLSDLPNGDERGLLTEYIDEGCNKVGDKLFYKLA